MNTDFSTTFKTALSLCVVAALKLNQRWMFGQLKSQIQKYTEIGNSHIVNATIKYLLDSGRFSDPLL